jgi:hypothetical protein
MRPLSVALILLATATAADAARPLHRYAIVIAHNRSLDPGVSPLRYADDDGARYYELFKLETDRVALFSVLDDETARLFPDAARAARAPEAEAIYGLLGRWNQEMERDARAGRETELIFVYAGHGDVDAAGEGYVNLLGSKLRRRDLYQKVLAPSKATYLHLIIDACKSYFLLKQRGAWKDDSAPDSHEGEVKAFLSREDLSAYPRAGVVLATSGDQSTHEWSRYRGGILSHELRSALAGSADVNGDGRIEYSEMHAFISAANARLRHPEARLNIFVRPPALNRHQPLVDLRQARRARLLRFDAAVSGRFHLEDDRGIRYADLHKAPGLRFDLALERGRSYFVYRENQEARLVAGSARAAVSGLAFAPSSIAMRSGLEQSFRRDLYQLAYSRGFYDGFCARTGLPPVEGGPEEFQIDARDEGAPRAAHRHALSLGYGLGAALLDLEGVAHGLELRYELGLHRHLALSVAVEYARSSHEDGARIDRLAVLAGAAGRLPLGRYLELRAELALGYQGLFGSGPVLLLGRRVEGSDPAGLRLEAGAGARVRLGAVLFLEARGGLGLDLVTVEPEEKVHAAPYGALGLGARF